MATLYSPFVPPGSLVFDIGANRGAYAQVFLNLGARVISVEPNPICASELRRLGASFPRLTVVEKAVGESPGKAAFHVCEDSTISTLSDRWLEVAKQSRYHKDARWSQDRTVSVTTIDELASTYGEPIFIKIDVEGLDDQVLRGMSFLPPALSFEFNTTIPEVAQNCLNLPLIVGNYEFNLDEGLEPRLRLERWLDAAEMKHLLTVQTCESGDVVARLRARSSA